jgi:hypothetical protein
MAIEDIQIVTGHKNGVSVERYTKRVSDTKKKNLSDSLSLSMCKFSSLFISP